MSRKGRLGRRPFFIYPYPSPPLLQVGSALRADLVAFAWVGSGPRHDIAVAEQFSGDGHGGPHFGSQLFSLQPPEPGCQLPDGRTAGT